MTAETRRDLHTAIFFKLKPPVYPRGRTLKFLHAEIRNEVDCTEQELEAELHYFKDSGLVIDLQQDKHNPDLPVFWALTAEGLREARARGLCT